MRLRILTSAMLASSMFFGMSGAPAFADDGERIVRSVSSPPGETADPEPEGEHAFMSLMNFHVPSQNAAGDLVPIEYNNIDGLLVKTEEKAKPLINVFVFGPVDAFESFSQSGFPGHGRRDGFGAVSLDDGLTWKATNLSNSADLSSFEIAIPIPDPGAPSTGGSVIVVDDPDGATIEEAEWEEEGNFAELEVEGEAEPRSRVTIRNAVTQEELAVTRTDRRGEFEVEVRLEVPPCFVQAGVDGVFGPAVEVVGEEGEEVEDCEGPDGGGDALITAYPGDVTNIFHSTAGNKVMVAWQSKFCQAGFPGYTGGAVSDADAIAGYLGIDNLVDLYLTDLFVVAGNQLSVDYREQEEFPGEFDDVGEVPYNCLWSARGVLREDPEADGTTELVWFQAERLTSGRRDVNRVETKCVAGAGCAVTWQEDPDGLRPGEGEGPGTGWAGATTNSQTDIWYSFVEWEDFDIVNDNGDPLPLADEELETGRPQPYVPMMVPVRLSNNARCQTDAADGYCSVVATDYGVKDQCIDTVEIPLGPQGNLTPVCVVDANGSGTLDTGDMPNVANTAASRPRLNLQPRDSDGDGVTDDAFVIIIHEEDKGLGRFGFLNDEIWGGDVNTIATDCEDPDGTPDDNCVRADIGKNQWYISFALGTPQTSVSEDEFGMIDNLVAQQNQYNAPEVNWITGTFYPPMSTADMWEFGDTLDFSIFNTEIARRASMMSQSVAKAEASTSKLVAMPLFKEGIINQGGPADIMARRVVAPMDADPSAGIDEQTANPYDFANLQCAWYDGLGGVTEGTILFDDGLNPYYPKGLCTAPTINLSNRTPYTCEVTGISDGVCPGAADMTCVDDGTFGQLCLSTTDPEDNQTLDKLLTWYECPGWNGTDVSNAGGADTVPGACGQEPDSALLGANLDDRSWYMPIDISKAHRGFLDGDFIAMIYAWSPNWKLNAVGTDRYELYTRRSFDGGVTWTTTPTSFTASDGVAYSGSGTTTCETWRDGDGSLTDSHVCTEYAAGVAEQSRDVTQHKSMRVTTLDPRFTPTSASMPTVAPEDIVWGIFEPIDGSDGGDPTDVRNPSRWFIVFETGDNTTVAEGEAEPLNLDYGRAEVFGDHFTVWSEIDTGLSDPVADCYPSNAHDTTDVDWATGTGFCNEFDTMEGFPLALSEEASITSSAYGDFLYGVWGQFNVDEAGEFIDGDSMFRRIWYIDDYISVDNSYTLPGDAQVPNP